MRETTSQTRWVDRVPTAVAGIAIGVLMAYLAPTGWVFAEREGPAEPDGAADDSYACAMFCVVLEELPGDERCPVCGMELTPVSGETSLDQDQRRMIGLEAQALRRVPLAHTVRAVGEIDYDETRLARITTRSAGWLDDVWADTTWMQIEKGQRLASFYSPELYAAQKEYLVQLDRVGDDASGSTRPLLAAAERRMKLLGIAAEEIEALRRARAVREALVLRAPLDGVVVERHAVRGASVDKGETLYTIADLSRVWIQAEVFERDLTWVRVGQTVWVQIDNRAEPIRGRVAFVDPVINRHTRVARMRIEVENPLLPDGTRLLRIGQRADARIEARLDEEGALVPAASDDVRDPLAVPRSSVLSTGERSVVYVLFTEAAGLHEATRDYRLDPERLPATVFYEMVEVRLGPLARRTGSSKEYYPVVGVVPSSEGGLDRLREGIVVVTHGNLLLDSQAQLSGKPSLLFPEGSRKGN